MDTCSRYLHWDRWFDVFFLGAHSLFVLEQKVVLKRGRDTGDFYICGMRFGFPQYSSSLKLNKMHGLSA